MALILSVLSMERLFSYVYCANEHHNNFALILSELKCREGRRSGALWGKVYVSSKKKKMLRSEGLGLNRE